MGLMVHERVGKLPGYPLAHIPRRKRELQAAGVDVIDLGAGDADFKPPELAIETLRAALEDVGLHKYGFQLGLPAFREAVVRYMARRFAVTFDPMEEVLPLIGSKEGLAHFAQTLAGPGDVVIVPEPGYQCYVGGTVCAGAEPYVYPLTARTRFLVELSEVPADVLRRTRLLFLNYPNNPTAAVAPLDYLERTVALCRDHGIAIAYDNPYVDITFDGYRAPSIFQVPGAREVAVEFHSCSKSFSMTGWRVAWAVGGKPLIGALTKVKNYFDTGAFMALQAAAVAVLDRAEELVAREVGIFQARRDAAVAAMRAAGFTVEVPQATLYCWVPLPAHVRSLEFQRVAMEEFGVITLPGSGFGPSAEGYFRIALTQPEPRIVEAAERLGKALARF
jgi:LL-diaminopimelate aminotransferase